jgi:hypothetical protein
LSDLSLANHAGLTLGDFLSRPSSSGPSPQSSAHVTPAHVTPEGSPKSASARQDPGVRPDRNSGSSEASSEGLDHILGLMGGGKFKNWDDIRTGLNRNADNDARLDKIPFIASHLDPDKPSPEHERLNWTRLPDSNHPMFSDFVITQNPQFYSFRRPEQHSAPLAGQTPQARTHVPDRGGAGLERSQSLPTDFRSPAEPLPSAALVPEGSQGGTGTGANGAGAAGNGASGSDPREEGVPADADGSRPHGTGQHASAGPADSRMEDLIQENARLKSKIKDVTTKAIAGGVAAAGMGLVAGMLIEGGTDDSSRPSSSPAGNV